jgi:hypothetical protein
MDRFHHPALGVSSPSLAEVRARSTPEARVVWDAAANLSAWRQASVARVESELRPYGASESIESRSLAREPGISGPDLARAFLALHPDRIGFEMSDEVVFWRRLALDASSDKADALSYALGRRLAWLASEEIDLDSLLRALPTHGLRVLARLWPAFREGLVTEQEAYGKIVDALVACGRAPALEPRVLWDRIRCSLDDERPGYAIVGPALSGKRTLLHRMKEFFPTRGVNVDNFHGGGSPDPKCRARPSAVFAAMNPNAHLLCCWSNAAMLEPELLSYALEIALDPNADLRLAITATQQQFDEIVQREPAARRLSIIRTPAIRDDELLTVWLCQRPRIEDVRGKRFDLFRLLGRIGYLRRYAPAGLLLRKLLEALDMTGAADFAGSDWGEDLFGTEARVFGQNRHRPQEPQRAWERLVRGERSWIEPFVTSAERLHALLELDDAISGKAAPPEGASMRSTPSA